MRLLSSEELILVGGGEGDVGFPPFEDPTGRNNNGYGNGAESGPPPGHSGGHNPQLLGWNLGPRGDR